MKYAEGSAKLTEYRSQIAAIRAKMRETQIAVEPEEIGDYTFQTPEGPTQLSQLFGDKDDLIVILNMGSACPACTLWADGYSGIHHHIVTRTAFVVASPDSPQVQTEFAASRNWTFPMVSHQGTSFAEDMGYKSKEGRWRPGIAVFQRQGNKIARVSDTGLGPRDDFCSLWHMFDMLPGGAGDWFPKKQYV